MRPRFQDSAAGSAFDGAEGPRLLVLFGSRLGGLLQGHRPWAFARSTDGSPHARLFLRDGMRAWYIRGVREFPSVESTAQLIRLVADGYDRVTLFGNSMGGFGALLFSRLLGLEAVAVNPQSFVDAALRAKHGDDRWAEDLDFVQPGPYGDLLALPASRERLIYSAGDRLDALHSERLAAPGVTLDPRPTASHDLARRLADTGELAGLLR